MSFTVELFLYFITKANHMSTENAKVNDSWEKNLLSVELVDLSSRVSI